MRNLGDAGVRVDLDGDLVDLLRPQSNAVDDSLVLDVDVTHQGDR